MLTEEIIICDACKGVGEWGAHPDMYPPAPDICNKCEGTGRLTKQVTIKAYRSLNPLVGFRVEAKTKMMQASYAMPMPPKEEPKDDSK